MIPNNTFSNPDIPPKRKQRPVHRPASLFRFSMKSGSVAYPYKTYWKKEIKRPNIGKDRALTQAHSTMVIAAHTGL